MADVELKDVLLSGDIVDISLTGGISVKAKEDKSEKAQADGYAGLDSDSKVAGVDVSVTLPFAAGTETVQERMDDPYHDKVIPDHGLSMGDLRSLEIGRTYDFPTDDQETSPGSGAMIAVAKTMTIGIAQTRHRYVNACIVRTGKHTWAAIAEEYTGTTIQPTIIWQLDAEAAWPDHSGVGSMGALSFTSVTTTILEEIGDATLLGADTLVSKLLDHEKNDIAMSGRIATLEGGASHAHVDVVQDFHLWINNQGPGYLIINDRPTDVDHIGKDLFDGAEHKIVLKWDEAPPHSQATPFDPAHFEDPAGSGTYHDWTHHNPTPTVWLMKGSEFKRLIDPITKAVFPWTTIYSLVTAGSVLTVKWDNVDTVLGVYKVEAPTVHQATVPDHHPLQVGGKIDANSVPFVSLNTGQINSVKNNSLYLDDSQVLKWKDNSGTSHTVTLS